MRIIKYDFRHHIYALQNMEKEEQDRYLKNLKEELDRTAQMVFCQGQAVNGLLQECAARARQEDITFEARADLSAHASVDDLMLCIVIGNPLENAFEACRRISEVRSMRVQARWMDNHLMMMVENFYNGQITQRGGKILSSKKGRGPGMLSIRRILNHPGDEFNVDYDSTTFTAMVKIVDRVMAE